MLAKFTLYDFIAVIVPGAFLLWAAGGISGIPDLAALTIVGNFAEASIFIVLSYITGLILSAIGERFTERVLLYYWDGYPSARWLLEEDTTWSDQYRAELWACIEKAFGRLRATLPGKEAGRKTRLHRNQEVFYRCYRSLEKISDLPQIFNAQYGLFRSLLTAFTLLGALASAKMAVELFAGRAITAADLRATALMCIGGLASLWKVKKRGEDFARAVFDCFISNLGRGGEKGP